MGLLEKHIISSDILNVTNFHQHYFRWKKCTPKSMYVLSKGKLRQIAVIFKAYTKINNFFKNTLNIDCKYTAKTQKLLLSIISLNFYTKRRQKSNKKDNLQPTEYVYSRKFTPTQKNLHKRFFVMLVTFKRSALV